jgi:hypothetical protein
MASFLLYCILRGRSSPVERLLAKEKAVGSIPIARSLQLSSLFIVKNKDYEVKENSR